MSQNTSAAPAAENKMGTMPVGKLLFNMSLPMMVSMLVQALYNIVDSIFVAKLSENALTAVSLAFPLQTLLIAVATGTGVGMNALLSKSLGEHDFKKANKIADNGIFLYVLSYIVFLILGFTVVKPFYASQIGSADVEIMELGIDYLSTVMILSFGLFGQIFFETADFHWKNDFQYDVPALRCDHQYYSGSDPDFRSPRCPENGSNRCSTCHCHRTMCCRYYRLRMQPQVQSRSLLKHQRIPT